MNVAAKLVPPRDTGRAQFKLTVPDFLMLLNAGVFAGYSKTELLSGELWGVPLQRVDEIESDASVPVKLRVADYLMLDRSGALAKDRRTELIDGLVYEVSPQHRPHMLAHSELSYRMRRALEEVGSMYFVGVEGSVALSEADLPQADILLTNAQRGMGPVPVTSVPLIVEIADSSLQYVLSTKGLLYASRGVPEYWVVDINARRLHQFWAPAAAGYGQNKTWTLGEQVNSVVVRDLVVETDGLI